MIHNNYDVTGASYIERNKLYKPVSKFTSIDTIKHRWETNSKLLCRWDTQRYIYQHFYKWTEENETNCNPI